MKKIIFLTMSLMILASLAGCKPSPFQCDIKDDSLLFAVSGESGSNTLDANHTRDFTPGKQTINLDDTLTYENSKNSYHITGTIIINSEKNSISSYEITATGGLFGDTAQVCKGP